MSQDILTSTFMSFRAVLHRAAARIVGSDDDAEDVLHDAFCRLWSRNVEINDSSDAIRLSYVAVRNSAIDTVRRSGHYTSVSAETLALPYESEDAADNEDIYNAVIEISRKALSERQFEVFRLHDIEGIDYDEIAERLGLSNENVRTIISRSRKTIRDIYRRNK